MDHPPPSSLRVFRDADSLAGSWRIAGGGCLPQGSGSSPEPTCHRLAAQLLSVMQDPPTPSGLGGSCTWSGWAACCRQRSSRWVLWPPLGPPGEPCGLWSYCVRHVLPRAERSATHTALRSCVWASADTWAPTLLSPPLPLRDSVALSLALGPAIPSQGRSLFQGFLGALR